MSLVELVLLAIALSMDAFAVAICAGLTMPKVNLKKALVIGGYFGGFQAAMPIIGYLVAKLFADLIITWDHWIAFGLLAFIGGKMIWESLEKDDSDDDSDGEVAEASVKPSVMLPLALATSIDALAVGVSFAFLKVSIVPAAAFIGVTTMAISLLGVKIGSLFGTRFKSKAEFAGGVILVLIGLKILLEHLGVIAF
ncbi:MAG: manganese efflux pump MntP family protein [Propionibacteriaceae bacterium]|nr:manganese efflux pump MntP family protein [Propionibacteriaceae bacterium]